MSLKFWYMISAAGLAAFFAILAAWALVQWSQGSGGVYMLEALVGLGTCFGLITHAVLYWRRLDEVNLL